MRLRSRLLLGSALAALAVVAGVLLARRAASSAPPSLLIVTLDTTRADAVPGFGGDARALPSLAGWSQESLRFTRAFSPAPVTLPAHLSLFSGQSPWWSAVRANGVPPSSAAPLELLSSARRRGYRSGAFVGTALLDPRYSRLVGFDVFDVPQWQRDARGVVDAAVSYLRSLGPEEPAVVWAHFFDAHLPYDPEAPRWQRCPEDERQAAVKAARTPMDLECMHGSPTADERRRLAPCLLDLYLSELAEIDRELPRLRDAMAQRGPYAWVVVADHGECIGDEDHLGRHVGLLLDCAVHVPLFTGQSDGSIAPGERTELVSTVDVAPTMAGLVGLELSSAEGVSLLEPGRAAAAAVGFETSGADLPGCGGASWGARLERERVVLQQPVAWNMFGLVTASSDVEPAVRAFAGHQTLTEVAPIELSAPAAHLVDALRILPPAPPPRALTPAAARGTSRSLIPAAPLPPGVQPVPLAKGVPMPLAKGVPVPLANGVPAPLATGAPAPHASPPQPAEDAAREETLRSLGYIQ